MKCIHPTCVLQALTDENTCIFHVKRDNKKQSELVWGLNQLKKKGIKQIVEAHLRGADFSFLSIDERNFQSSDLTGADFNNSRLSKVGFDFSLIDNVNFENVIFDRVDLRRVVSGKNIYFYRAIFAPTLMPPIEVFSKICVYEKMKPREPQKAYDVYQKLKNAYKSQDQHAATSLMYEREMKLKTELAPFIEKFWLVALWLLCGYGERPIRTFINFIIIISIFALIYANCTLIGPNGVISGNYWESLYFSTITFTSLGYGDIRPVGIAKLFAAIESLLGVFLISLFVFVFCRKMIR